NLGSTPLRDIRYARSVNLLLNGRTDTRNDVLDPRTAASWHEPGQGALVLGSGDPRAVATAIAGVGGSNPDFLLANVWDPNGEQGDFFLHLVFRLGSLEPGASTAMTFAFGLGRTLEEAREAFALSRDDDGDGLPDLLEERLGLDPEDGSDAFLDLDADHLTNLAEYRLGTRLDAGDSDGDGMADGQEVRFGLDPLHDDAGADLDGDGLGNLDEITRGIDPGRPDSDGDGIGDGLEVASGLEPGDPSDGAGDLDGDGLANAAEVAAGTDLSRPDSDGDGL